MMDKDFRIKPEKPTKTKKPWVSMWQRVDDKVRPFWRGLERCVDELPALTFTSAAILAIGAGLAFLGAFAKPFAELDFSKIVAGVILSDVALAFIGIVVYNIVKNLIPYLIDEIVKSKRVFKSILENK